MFLNKNMPLNKYEGQSEIIRIREKRAFEKPLIAQALKFDLLYGIRSIMVNARLNVSSHEVGMESYSIMIHKKKKMAYTHRETCFSSNFRRYGSCSIYNNGEQTILKIAEISLFVESATIDEIFHQELKVTKK